MAGLCTGWLFNTIRPTFNHITSTVVCPALYLQTRDYAARKGTRMKRLALKQKTKTVKKLEPPTFTQLLKQIKEARGQKNKMFVYIDDSDKPDIPSDDVYITRLFKWKVYPFEEAIQCHRETHDPTMYDSPDAYLQAYIELDLHTKKKTKFLEKINRIVLLPHIFDQNIERNILFLSNNEESRNIALTIGADAVAGKEIVKEIKDGKYHVDHFDYVLADPEIVPHLLLIRSIMGKKFPSLSMGTLSNDVENLVRKHTEGLQYKLEKDEFQKEYGIVRANIGTLNMDIKNLEENFAALLQDLVQVQPRKDAAFIIRTRLASEPSKEMFPVAFNQYIGKAAKPRKKVEEEEEEEDAEESEDTRAVIGTT